MVGVLMVGAGEYTAGFVKGEHGAAVDKPAGVVALTCFDLRRLGVVDRLVLCDHSGRHFPAIRATLQRKIGEVYRGMDLTLTTVPDDSVERDDAAYLKAIQLMQAGDVVTVFTPDDTHCDIALAAIRAGLHVLVAKPLVKTLQQHRLLAQEADRHGVLVAVEYHKRFDPVYSDARLRIRALGAFSYFSALMAQPKQQLATFSRWAGLASDISYYLNSHHIDFHNWSVAHMARPTRVTASAATGAAAKLLGRPCEDTITLLVTWDSLPGQPASTGTAIYTASWIAPKGECHTQQEWLYMGQEGLLRADQAHRGYSCTSDADGYSALNPLYMRYVPDQNGNFAGQGGYGYVSIARFVEAARSISQGAHNVAHYQQERMLALVADVLPVTAVLEAGRLSLDHGGAPVAVRYDADGRPLAVELEGATI